MIITTTNSIENATIEKYLGVVTSNMAIGTAYYSEFLISLSDFFGGFSGQYRREMDSLYKKAYDTISFKANKVGANGILGLKIDFDEISGKGAQMIMISISGTAVKLKFDETHIRLDDAASVSHDAVNIEMFKLRWNRRHKSQTPTHSDLTFIVENGLWDLIQSLYEYYTAENLTALQRPIDERFSIILSVIPYADAVKVIYNDYPKLVNFAFPLIKENRLFSAQKVLDLLHDGHLGLAVDLLQTDKDVYSCEDIHLMEMIVEYLENLPDRGRIAEVKVGPLSSKTVEKYICPLGHKNDKDVEYCEHGNNPPFCGLNIKGLTYAQVGIIETFKERVSVIKMLLDK